MGEVHVEDEENLAEEDLAVMTVKLTRLNLEENEAVGCVHAPYFPGPKFEEWWLLIYDERDRRVVTVEAVTGTNREETAKIRFMVPRKGDFKWAVHAMCDSYMGMDVTKEVRFKALSKREVKKEIFIHPHDMHIRTLFEEIMLGPLMDEDEDSDSDSEDDRGPAKKAAAAAKAKAKAAAAAAAAAAAGSKDADSDEEEHDGEPDGVYYRISQLGAHIYGQPDESTPR